MFPDLFFQPREFFHRILEEEWVKMQVKASPAEALTTSPNLIMAFLSLSSGDS